MQYNGIFNLFLSSVKFNNEHLIANFVLYSFINTFKLCDFTFSPDFASTGIIKFL